jgi:membrane fusion protein (multidrug efflux system)
MPAEITEHSGGSSSVDALATAKEEAAADREDKLPQSDPASKAVLPTDQRSKHRRRLLIGVLGALVLALASVFGIPWIRLALSTVSTDDAFVNGHVTLVAPRVHGQVSRVPVDDNNRVHEGDILVQLDKEPFRDAVAVKQAAVDTAQADLQAAGATVCGIEAQARSRRWQLQQAIENVENQIALLHARVAALKKAKATVTLAQQEFDRTSKLVGSVTASRELYDQREAALLIAQAGVVQALVDVNQIRVSLGLQAQPEDSGDLDQVPPDLDQTFSAVLQGAGRADSDCGRAGRSPFLQPVSEADARRARKARSRRGHRPHIRPAGCVTLSLRDARQRLRRKAQSEPACAGCEH